MSASEVQRRRLEGKVAIITGGASGFGESAARLFVQNGASVLIVDIQDEVGRRLAAELGEEDGVAAYVHCDVTVEEEVEAAVAMAVNKWGKLDVMFSNAGIAGNTAAGAEKVENLDMGWLDRVLKVNVKGSALAVKHAARAMVKGGVKNGSIICTASICGTAGGIGTPDYTISKHAVLGLMRSAASDLGQHGIRVNCISPSIALTPLTVNAFRQFVLNPDLPIPHMQSLVDSNNVLRHHSLSPLHVAYAALYLASDESSFLSGHNLLLDGALTSTVQGVAFSARSGTEDARNVTENS